MVLCLYHIWVISRKQYQRGEIRERKSMWTMQDSHTLYQFCVDYNLCVRKLMIGGMSPNQKLIEQAKENGCMKATLLIRGLKQDNATKSAEARSIPYNNMLFMNTMLMENDIRLYFIESNSVWAAALHIRKYCIIKKGHPKKAISEGQAGKEAKMEGGMSVINTRIPFLCTIGVARLLVRLV